MIDFDLLRAWVAVSYARVRGSDPERGDVPGWVMVTIMTAGLVVVIFALFKDKITTAVSDAIDSVTNKTK
ncbi:hypothetical protein SAMN05892883_2365 [Jatrophihabitans sp. GAS493]|uniref:hypothetical protein n=1 Tax=Jatrophihabitans sp. GAS493 TaxID=1907575 RepID=UPI000BB926E7|nr:hypothetical protein [Jatrophihabitans sp. GAS493]SOD73067.1 hypothetical protein SAMN05892883_2365 [Jatrophihabitans sp. GAS493]